MRVLTEADPAHAELAVVRAGAAADFAAVVRAHAELRRALRLLDQRGLGHYRVAPVVPAGFCSGKPIWVRNSVASSSFLAVVTMTMSMPRALSTLSKSISGNTSCSRRPRLKMPP